MSRLQGKDWWRKNQNERTKAGTSPQKTTRVYACTLFTHIIGVDTEHVFETQGCGGAMVVEEAVEVRQGHR